MANAIISRNQAKEKELKKYFTGKPCKHGHIVERYVANKACLNCYKRWLAVPENAEKKRKRDRAYFAANKARFYAHSKISQAKRRIREPYWDILRRAKHRSKKKKMPFDLTLAWARERWTGKCEATGIPFDLANRRLVPFSFSLDKIKPELGYIQSNCRFILFGLNALKGCGSDEDALRIAKAIIEKSVMYQLPCRCERPTNEVLNGIDPNTTVLKDFNQLLS